ncbi:MAG: hypothetical protein LBS00_03875 [Synergistaceae bacterium]|jgi:hypothetical protein|nr:hypothetical protein [Synergistaceae bacterium]
MREMLDLYAQETTFRDQVALDLEDGAAWFNIDEFGKFHDIEGKKVLSVFAGDRRGQTIVIRSDAKENSEGIVKSRGILFVRADEMDGVRADQALRLDGRLYTVAEARIIQDRVWRIVLEANES